MSADLDALLTMYRSAKTAETKAIERGRMAQQELATAQREAEAAARTLKALIPLIQLQPGGSAAIGAANLELADARASASSKTPTASASPTPSAVEATTPAPSAVQRQSVPTASAVSDRPKL